MFCPNCGAKNGKKQNYCRFCGLNLQDAAKSLTNQIVFGSDTKLLKTLSSVKRIANSASTALIGALIVGVAAYLYFAPDFGKDLMKISLALFFLLQTAQEIIGYAQRRERTKDKPNELEPDKIEGFESKETAKFLGEKTFEPVPGAVENSTELFAMENKTRKL